ncbi:MAG TPA: SDR family NAD(P)-dependent oxidoreductase, partial [Candidatus Dormibacteraeota bacterium]|nr:SDR family NAD(P)-dependent oxidoreductase [Candidatus Dormibacteraeota bacterium]
MNHIDLKGRTAIVTGGARGIGYAITSRLLESGATCCIWDRDETAGRAAAESLSAQGSVHAVPVDITRPQSVQAAADLTCERLGQV